MIQPGGGGLDPPQSTGTNHFVPGHGHLGVSAKHIGRQDFVGDPFLTGIHHFAAGQTAGFALNVGAEVGSRGQYGLGAMRTMEANVAVVQVRARPWSNLRETALLC